MVNILLAFATIITGLLFFVDEAGAIPCTATADCPPGFGSPYCFNGQCYYFGIGALRIPRYTSQIRYGLTIRRCVNPFEAFKVTSEYQGKTSCRPASNTWT